MGKYYLRRHQHFLRTQIPASYRFLSSKPFSKDIDEFANLCSQGNLNQAFERFRFEIWADPNLFSRLLQGCIPTKSLSLAKQIHSLIIASGCSADRFLNNHLVNVYAKFGQLGSALTLYRVMPRKNIMSSNILIGGLIQNHDLEGARKLFDEMPERNVESWNAIVAGMIHLELYEEGLGLFLEMLGSGFSPDCFTLGSVIRGCAGLEALPFGKQVQGYAIKIGLEVHLVVGSALAHMYTRCKSLEDGERVIREMPVRNVVAYNTLIGGRYQNGNPEGAFHLYKLMKTAGFLPDEITFVNMISSCSELTTLGQGQQIHAEVIKSGAALNVPVTSSLISMYSRCGDMECSEKAFMENPQKDCVLSSSMIAAYGFHGQGKKAIAVFEQMTEEEGLLEVNEVTFLSLLYACSHSGLRDQGTEFFDLMVNKYGLDPKLEHYTCMVDLLGRSGRLQEAEDMIRSMPVEVEADVIIWKTLLSACRIHKNAIMAGKVAGEIRRLDPQDSASYVLLASIHASGKRWSEVSSLRKAMKERKVKKEPGISWFEYKNTVYQFIAGGDKSHPNWGKIEVYMKELMSEMKKKGYVPDTSSVYHDLDKEEMESNLIHHSEKLAIAFALIIIPPNLPIRVMKNLRVCDDCHGAIKLISEIRQREIIVRDATRFHHFKNGRCSCGDYW